MARYIYADVTNFIGSFIYEVMKVMTDEHIGVIEDLKSTMSVCIPEPDKTEICTSLSKAIDTMRKYQKIKQIIHDDWIKGVNSGATLNKIEKVLEDENDNSKI